MLLGHLNVRSLMLHFQTLCNFVTVNNFDLFFVSETWLNSNLSSILVTIPDYTFYRVDRINSQGRGGGIGVYLSKSLKFNIIHQSSSSEIEELWLQIISGRAKYVIGCIYRPQSSSVDKFIDAIENSITDLLGHFDNIIITGDWNIDLLKNCPNSIQLNNFFESFDLCQVIDEPTFIRNNTYSLLDLLVTSNKDLIQNFRTEFVNGISENDHCAIICDLKIFKPKNRIKFITYRDYSNFSQQALSAHLNLINWNEIYEFESVNDAVQYLNSHLLEIFSQCAPLKSIRSTKPPAPWLTPVIKIMMRKRDQSYVKFRRTKVPAHFEYYKMLRNFTTHAIEREKKAYLNFCLRNKCSKAKWRTLKTLNILHTNDSSLPNHLINVDSINEHFTKVPLISDEPSTIEILTKYRTEKFLAIRPFIFIQVPKHTVLKALNSIKSNAAGSDSISLKMLLFVSDYLIDHITYIINACISSSTFPEAWKTAIVLPLPKTACPETLNDLRPISLLPILSKLLEKILYDQLSSYLFEHNIIPSLQSGFRTGHSTATALTTIIDDIFRALDQGRLTCLVLLDYSKAFDSIDQRILIAKLGYFGLDTSAVELLQSYLCDRSQKVTYNNEISKPLKLTHGVPQGSILGPILFLLYVADFHTIVSHCSSHHYADDTQVYLPFDSTDNTASVKINSDLDALVDISTTHNLKINPSKSSVILFGPKDKRNTIKNSLSIKIKNDTVILKDEVKNLGLWLDNDLRFTKHVNMICQSSYIVLKQLFPNKSIMSASLKLELGETLILPKLSYCDTVYGPALLATDSYRLQKIQNSYFRFAYGIRKFEHISYKITEMNRLKLEQLRKVHLLTLTHKIIITKKPIYLYKKLVRIGNVSSYITRNSSLLLIYKHKTAMFKRSFTYSVCKLYNDLPPEFFDYSLLNFKRKLKALFLSIG